MRIAFLTGADDSVGHGSVDRMSEEMEALGHEVSVFRLPSGERGFFGRSGVAGRVLSHRFDVIHADTDRAFPIAFAYRTFRPRTGIVFSVRTDGSRKGRPSRWLTRHVADRLVATDMAEHPDRDRSGDSATVLPEWSEAARTGTVEFLRGFGLREGRYVLFVSRDTGNADTDYVVKAFRGLEDTGRLPNNFKLAVIGADADIPAYERYPGSPIESRGSVIFLGEQAGQSRCELFSHAALSIHPVSSDALSALPEAMGYGLAVVAGDTPSNREVLGTAGTYWRDTVSLGRTLAYLLGRPDERGSYGKLARERFHIRYSPESVGRRLSDLYAEAIRYRLGNAYGMQRHNHNI